MPASGCFRVSQRFGVLIEGTAQPGSPATAEGRVSPTWLEMRWEEVLKPPEPNVRSRYSIDHPPPVPWPLHAKRCPWVTGCRPGGATCERSTAGSRRRPRRPGVPPGCRSVLARGYCEGHLLRGSKRIQRRTVSARVEGATCEEPTPWLPVIGDSTPAAQEQSEPHVQCVNRPAVAPAFEVDMPVSPILHPGRLHRGQTRITTRTIRDVHDTRLSRFLSNHHTCKRDSCRNCRLSSSLQRGSPAAVYACGQVAAAW